MTRRRESLVAMLNETYGLRLLLDRRIQVAVLGAVLFVVLFIRLGQVLYSGTAWMIGYDFSAYWLAGRNLLEGNPIYTIEQLSGPYSAQQQFLYLYPPLLAVLVSPLSALFPISFETPAWIWASLGAGLLVASVTTIARADGRGVREVLLLLALAFSLPPVALELLMGNVHLVLVGLLAVVWLAMRQDSLGGDILAGVSLAGAVLIKVFPALLIVWMLASGRVRPAIATLLAIAALALASLPITGLDPWLSYPAVLANLEAPTDMSNVLAPTVWLGHVIDPDLARLIVIGLCLAGTIWSGLRQPRDLSFAVTVLLSIAIVPALYLHYLALAVLPLVVVYARLRSSLALYASIVLLFVGTQLLLLDPTSTLDRAWATLSLLGVLAVLLLARGHSWTGAVLPQHAGLAGTDHAAVDRR